MAASGKRKNNWSKRAKKAIKRTHRGITLIGILCLLIGFALGYIGAEYLSENDCFELLGEQEIAVAQGTTYSYTEEGVKIISFSRDLSSQVQITTDLPIDENGNYMIDTSVETTYIITYTVEDIKYGNIKRIRKITVVGGEF